MQERKNEGERAEREFQQFFHWVCSNIITQLMHLGFVEWGVPFDQRCPLDAGFFWKHMSYPMVWITKIPIPSEPFNMKMFISKKAS
jgi:hypothetical protein